MLNPQKLKMSFKRYCNNFVNGIKFEDVVEKYEVSKSKINNIVNFNDIEKDHILLINLNKISLYYLSKWKDEVLIGGGISSDGLKTMQIVVFYQCMAHELYQIKYPKMFLSYSFDEAIKALIHFTMFGWEKEEKILFDFILEHFGKHLMDANNWNKHTWFLLELYLQYRNKTIVGTNKNLYIAVREQFKEEKLEYDLIPEDLDIYSEVLEHWNTPQLDEINTLIEKMSVFHSILASELGGSIEFGDYRYGFYPYEILFLIYIRKKHGLLVPEHIDDFLMNTPEAKMTIGDPEPYPEWDPLLRQIDDFYRKNYPDYIPNKQGELFR